MPERLRRLDSLFERSPIYFVTACTENRRHLLADRALHDVFGQFAEAASDHGAWVGAYVLMPDHFHLFVALDDERLTLSDWIKSLKGTVSARLRTTAIGPPYWQKGFLDHVLRSEESYSQKWYYVRENPVRAGLASRWQDWPYTGEIFDLDYRADQS
ncbi:MAG: transposase [Verrucomicrobiota bacterium]